MRIVYLSSIALALLASPLASFANTDTDSSSSDAESAQGAESAQMATVTLRVDGMMKSQSGAT